MTLPFTLLQQATPTSNFGSHHVVTRSTQWILPVFAESSSDSDAASISQDRSFHFGKRGLWEISRITHTNDNNGCIFKRKANNLLEMKNSTVLIFYSNRALTDQLNFVLSQAITSSISMHIILKLLLKEGKGGPLSLIRAGFVQVCLSSPLRLRHISKE